MAQINYIPNSVLSAATIESGYSLNNLKTGMTSYYRTSSLSTPQWMKADIGGYNDFLNLYWPLEENILAPVGSGTPSFTVSNAGAYFSGTSGGYMSQITASTMRFEEISNVYWGLVEGAMSNLLPFSEDATNAVWWNKYSGASAFADTTIAPNGLMTADKITYNGAGAAGYLRVAISSDNPVVSVLGQVYTGSIWLKADTTTQLRIKLNHGVGLTTITITTSWQRFTYTAIGNGVSNLSLIVWALAANNDPFTIYVWGAQIETRSVVTSYFPRPTVAITVRTSETDYPTIPLTGNFTQAAGTAFVEWLPHFSNTDLALLEVVGILSVKNAGSTTLLYVFKDGGGGITLRSSDQTNSAYITFNFTAEKHYLLAVRWWSTAGNKPSDDANDTGIQVGYSDDNGLTWTWGARTDYDGEYQVLGTNLIVHFTTEWAYHLRNVRLYGKAFTTTEIEGGVENLDGSKLVNDFGFFNHNLSSTAAITLQADQEDYKNTWNSPLYSTTLPWTNKRIIDESLIQTYRFWKTSFSDVSNTDGYLEGAFWFLGTGLTDVTTGPAFSIVDLHDRFGDIKLSWTTTDY